MSPALTRIEKQEGRRLTPQQICALRLFEAPERPAKAEGAPADQRGVGRGAFR
jgi:hypothetical protein